MWLSFTVKRFHLSRLWNLVLIFRGREGKPQFVSNTEFAADSPTDPVGVQEPSAVACPRQDGPFPNEFTRVS